MVSSHRCGAEEGTTTPLFPQAPEEIWNESPHPPLILHLYCGEHPDRTAPAAIAKGRANCPPHCRRRASLSPGHLHQAVHEESPEDHQWLQPPKPWTVLSAALRQTVTQYPNTHKLRDSLFPQTIRLLNTRNWHSHSTPLCPYHSRCTFNSNTKMLYPSLSQLDLNVACTLTQQYSEHLHTNHYIYNHYVEYICIMFSALSGARSQAFHSPRHTCCWWCDNKSDLIWFEEMTLCYNVK